MLAPLGDDAVVAGIPVIALRDLRRRKRWVSLPFSDVCPPLRSPSVSAVTFTRALERARVEAGINSFEIRAPLAGAERRQHREAVLHTTRLAGDVAELFSRFHRSQVQRNIRRAEREELRVRESTGRSDFVETFYRLHNQTRNRQGMPVQPHRYFERLWDNLFAGDDAAPARLLLVETDEGQAIAGALLLAGTNTLTYKYGASDASFWPLRPNHLLFAHALWSSCEAGFAHFDWVGATSKTVACARSNAAGRQRRAI